MSIRIIGAGHVGSQISSQLKIEGTKRSGDLCFDSSDLSTYDKLKVDELIITFALGKESEENFNEFKKYIRSAKRVLLLSSVGAFENKGVIDEDTPISSGHRYQRELELYQGNVSIFYLAGIYDETRTPLQWLQKGLVSKHKKGVTLIHTSDIVKIIKKWIDHEIPPGKYILSDGVDYDWNDMISEYQKRNLLPEDFVRPDKKVLRLDKSLNNNKLVKVLGSDYKFENFYK